MISYDKKRLILSIKIGKYHKYFQCPFATWWRCRKYFKRPRFKFYFGPMWQYRGKKNTQFGEYDDHEYKGGYWPMASTEYLKWHTPKWFPIHIMSHDIGWKDKWNTPRYERPGYFIIFFGRNYKTCWQFSIVTHAPKIYCCNDCTCEDFDDNYWESMLWYLHYADEYNPDDLTYSPNLIKARESFRTNNWSKTETIELEDIKGLKYGKETLFLGENEINDFVYIDVQSDTLETLINGCHIYDNTFTSCDNIFLRAFEKPIKDNDKEHITLYGPKYVKIFVNKDYSESFIRMYFKDKNDLLMKLKNHLFSKIEYNWHKYIDLGPTFKDDFLNKRGIKEVQNYYKE